MYLISPDALCSFKNYKNGTLSSCWADKNAHCHLSRTCYCHPNDSIEFQSRDRKTNTEVTLSIKKISPQSVLPAYSNYFVDDNLTQTNSFYTVNWALPSLECFITYGSCSIIHFNGRVEFYGTRSFVTCSRIADYFAVILIYILSFIFSK